MPTNNRQNKFSIIVTNYNFQEYLEDSLTSVACQSYPDDHYEILCIDDGSTDESVSLIQGLSKKFKNLKCISIKNSGLEKACNLGIHASINEWVIRVDADDKIAENYLEVMNRAIQKNPRLDFFYAKHYYEFYSADDSRRKELPEFDFGEIFERGDFFSTGTVYRRDDLVKIHGFPEGVKNCGLENYSVILKLLSSGKVGGAVNDACFWYRRHHNNMSTVKRSAIIEYGKNLLKSYGRTFKTNKNHPYNLILS